MGPLLEGIPLQDEQYDDQHLPNPKVAWQKTGYQPKGSGASPVATKSADSSAVGLEVSHGTTSMSTGKEQAQEHCDTEVHPRVLPEGGQLPVDFLSSGEAKTMQFSMTTAQDAEGPRAS